MFAAIKSTADSQLLVGSSAVADIYKVAKKKASDMHMVWFSRVAVLVVACIAIWIALDAYDPAIGGPDHSTGVMVLVAMAWAGFGAAFGPLVLTSLFWKRTNLVGAIGGVAVGGLTVIIWQYIPLVDGTTLNTYTQIYSLVPGVFLSLITIIVLSLVTKAPSKEILEDFEKASKPSPEI
jgi:sodium/proline symporter